MPLFWEITKVEEVTFDSKETPFFPNEAKAGGGFTQCFGFLSSRFS